MGAAWLPNRWHDGHLAGRHRRWVASTKVVCDGPGDQRAEDMKAATA